MFSPGSALLAIAVGSSWYAACFIGGRYDFLSRQVGSENFGRFFGTLGTMAPWYYVEPLLLNSVAAEPARADRGGAALTAARRRRQAHAGYRPWTRPQCLAIFWVVSVVFFTLAALQAAHLPAAVMAAGAVLIAWWMEQQRSATLARIAQSGVHRVGRGADRFQPGHHSAPGSEDLRPRFVPQAAAQIDRIVGAGEPLFIYRMEDPAALLFYLDRPAPVVSGELGDAPPGYVIVPAKVWEHERQRALELEPILGPTPGSDPLILLRHGKDLCDA